MSFKINIWKGRLGNNINQVINALFYCIYMNTNLIIPKHKYFKNTIIIINNKCKNENIYCDKKNFIKFDKVDLIPSFKIKENKFLGPKIVNKRFKAKENILQLLKTNLIDNFTIKSLNNYNENTLIIYIRSGDLFNKTCVHPKYISAPYYFYKEILTKYKNNYDRYILVAEDTNNPVIKKLLEEYPNIEYNKNNLEDDIKIILGASHIISSVGTFIRGFSWISKNMKKVYLPSFVRSIGYYHNIQFEKIDLPNYKEHMCPWLNNKKQNKFLIDYKPN